MNFTNHTATFVNNGKANRQELERSLNEKFKIAKEFMEPIITLFIRFELAIPLDKNVLLIPSLLQSNNERFPVQPCVFPRARGNSHYDNIENYSHCKVTSKSDSLRSYDGNVGRQRSSTSYLPAVAQIAIGKQISLFHTRMCYRRVFGADHIPTNFWPRLIARFLSSVESFHKIICNNCFPNIRCEKFVNGGANIGSLKCEWSYGKNNVILTLGSDTILRVNGLYSFHDGDRQKRVRISDTVEQVKDMQVYHDNGYKSVNTNDGFEVNVPDYIVHSGIDPNNLTHKSELMSAQILSHVLETIDEVLKDWFEGLLEQGIYSDKYLTHFIPCPYCVADQPIFCIDSSDESDESDDDHHDEVYILPTSNNKPVGFSVQYCLSQARVSKYINCPNHKDTRSLPLKYLAPDIVSYKYF